MARHDRSVCLRLCAKTIAYDQPAKPARRQPRVRPSWCNREQQATLHRPPLGPPVVAPLGQQGAFRYAAAADGRRFLVLIEKNQNAQPPLTVVTDWRSLMKE